MELNSDSFCLKTDQKQAKDGFIDSISKIWWYRIIYFQTLVSILM